MLSFFFLKIPFVYWLTGGERHACALDCACEGQCAVEGPLLPPGKGPVTRLWPAIGTVRYLYQLHRLTGPGNFWFWFVFSTNQEISLWWVGSACLCSRRRGLGFLPQRMLGHTESKMQRPGPLRVPMMKSGLQAEDWGN